MHAGASKGIQGNWLDNQDDEGFLAWLAMLSVFFLLVVACAIARANAQEAQPKQVVSGGDYAQLSVIVRSREQEAELEVQTEAFDSYEQLREMVVDSLPEMFRDTDELTLEYQNARNKWVRVKLRTPVSVVKASACVRITAAAAAKAARR